MESKREALRHPLSNFYTVSFETLNYQLSCRFNAFDAISIISECKNMNFTAPRLPYNLYTIYLYHITLYPSQLVPSVTTTVR